MPEPAKPVPLASEAPSNDRPRILAVSDGTTLARAIQSGLREYDVVVADGAEGALQTLRSGPSFDVIFCNLTMPGTNGMALHEELMRSDPDHARRIVFLTGSVQTVAGERFMAGVPNLLLRKPFKLHALRQIIRSMTRTRAGGA